MRKLLFIICCLFQYGLFAHPGDSTIIEVSGLRFFDTIANRSFLYSAPKRTVKESEIPFLPYTDKPVNKKTVPDKLIEQECFVKFTLRNSADTSIELFFIPGFYLCDIEVYATNPGNLSRLQRVPKDTLSEKLFKGTRLLRLEAGETKVFFAKFNFVRTNVNNYNPRLVERDFLGSWVMLVKNVSGYMTIVTYIAIGIMLLMICYSMALYLQNRSTEFLFYCGYAFSVMIMIFLKYFFNFRVNPFIIFFEEYLDFMLLCGSVFFYLGFIRKFLNTGKREPLLEKMIRYTAAALTLFLAVFSYLYFFTDKYVILNVLENNVIKMLIFVISITVIIYSLKKKDPLLNYLAAGNIALMLFSMISLAMIIFKWKPFPALNFSILNSSMFYYEVGMILELMFFLFGLAYKNKKDIIAQVKEREQFKLENERKEFDKQMAIMAARQEERDRISADMHDDLGSGVTAIRLMSEIVKSKMKNEQFPEIDKISNSANELLGKMNSIIWTMKSSNDSVESLAAYLRAYATEYFDGTHVDCTVEVENVIEHELSGEKRRNIFLSFKETLNNILKHAKATKVHIIIDADENRLIVKIHDNGVGIDLKNLRRFGNGLSNIKKRIQSIDGEFTIGNENGTIVRFELNLNNAE